MSASLLLLASVLGSAPHVAEHGTLSDRVHLQLDGDATWGVGSQMFLGSQVRFATVLEHWSTRRATGTWDLGAAFAYQNEPIFLAPFIDAERVDGAAHRVQVLAHLGHTFHVGKRRRVGLGLHAYGGWNYWRSAYRVSYPDVDVEGSDVVARHHAIVGGEIRLAYRVHERVGLNLIVGAPFPTASSYGITYGHLGVGLSFYLR